jgi:hypothetical protein
MQEQGLICGVHTKILTMHKMATLSEKPNLLLRVESLIPDQKMPVDFRAAGDS